MSIKAQFANNIAVVMLYAIGGNKIDDRVLWQCVPWLGWNFFSVTDIYTEDQPKEESRRAGRGCVDMPPDRNLALVLGKLWIALCSLVQEIWTIRGAFREAWCMPCEWSTALSASSNQISSRGYNRVWELIAGTILRETPDFQSGNTYLAAHARHNGLQTSAGLCDETQLWC